MWGFQAAGAAPIVARPPDRPARDHRHGDPHRQPRVVAAGRWRRATRPAASSRRSPTSRSSPRTACCPAEVGIFVEPASAVGRRRPARAARRGPRPRRRADRHHGHRPRAQGPAVGAAHAGRRRRRPGAGLVGRGVHRHRPRPGLRPAMRLRGGPRPRPRPRHERQPRPGLRRARPGPRAVRRARGARARLAGRPGRGHGRGRRAGSRRRAAPGRQLAARGARPVGAPQTGLHLRCHNRIPHGRGLGLVRRGGRRRHRRRPRAHRRAATRCPTTSLLDLAASIEGHPDNAAPAVLGGATLAWQAATGCPRRSARGAPDVRAGRHRAADAASRPRPPAGSCPRRCRTPTPRSRPAAPRCWSRPSAAGPDLLLDATEDRLHQEYRALGRCRDSLALVDVLRARGVAAVVSGAGPTVLVLARAPARRRVATDADEATRPRSAVHGGLADPAARGRPRGRDVEPARPPVN